VFPVIAGSQHYLLPPMESKNASWKSFQPTGKTVTTQFKP
jgi:hypothetical protein